MAIPPMVAVAVPVAMPIPGLLSENVFLPVAPEMIVSISEIVCVSQIVSIPEIVCVPEIVSISELRSGVSLIPHTYNTWISGIREWRDSNALRDSCYCIWTRTRKGTSARIEGPPVRKRW